MEPLTIEDLQALLTAEQDLSDKKRLIREIEGLMFQAIGDNIQNQREALGLSRQMVARMIGTNANTLERIESGRYPQVTVRQYYWLAQMLGMTLADMLNGIPG